MESHNNISLTSCKVATKMEDLTETEVKLWIQWLKTFTDDVDDYKDNLFNEDNWEWEGYNDEIRVMIWEIISDDKTYKLIDMNGWPGDNESGAIFLNNEIIFTNRDTNLSHNDKTPKFLIDRKEDMEHVRTFSCYPSRDCTYCKELEGKVCQ
ncbi:Hypothetical protein ORPV_530 [Orpheovirus IHUMI-LCC2]|uniref:Uncharacterized protein n=1 Tax=Orpheovirus IHUMI-LCC2 TaxID=2023057 RepID=A0A2I2L4H8_9VIRU|nr:Hypothetical protein ORPV_530 [Orpheovirus IHUMI-LCC2]SNW62434.1 Hypothetical protein ORPV_530 [Orpheovirus IHUMI-LCC2]